MIACWMVAVSCWSALECVIKPKSRDFFLIWYLFSEYFYFEKIIYNSKRWFLFQKITSMYFKKDVKDLHWKKLFQKNSLYKIFLLKKRISHIKGLLMLLHSNRLKKFSNRKKNLFKRYPCFPKVIVWLYTYYSLWLPHHLALENPYKNFACFQHGFRLATSPV